ncbi:MAG: hypothetical protein CMO26_02860 [Thiotrichales bacterium]|nr:hypothetical protein [Thiotrichales bacterium]
MPLLFRGSHLGKLHPIEINGACVEDGLVGPVKDTSSQALLSLDVQLGGVREYFSERPDDLLKIFWEHGDGFEQLCRFLGDPTPNTPVPHANRGVDKVGSPFQIGLNRVLSRL